LTLGINCGIVQIVGTRVATVVPPDRRATMDFSNVIEIVKLISSIVKLFAYTVKAVKALKTRKKKPP
jgi:hypothetical protein